MGQRITVECNKDQSPRCIRRDQKAGVEAEKSRRWNEEVKRITMHQHSGLFSMQTGAHRAYAQTDGGPKVPLPLRFASGFLSISDYLLNSRVFFFSHEASDKASFKSSAASHLLGREPARPQGFLQNTRHCAALN